jgi:large subunit ribosomal protein L10
MPSKRNIELLQRIKEKADKAQGVFFVDYQGLTHKQLEDLRKTISATDAEFMVVKNSIANIAFRDKGLPELSGSTAALFSFSYSVDSLKLLFSEFKKIFADTGKKIKLGFFENRIIGPELVVELANLPAREVLIGKLVGLLKSPITGLVRSLSWNEQQLVWTLNAVKEKKQKAAGEKS